MDPIARHFAANHGVITRADAHKLGLSHSAISRQLTNGRWTPIHRGAYRLSGAPPTWNGDALAFASIMKGLVSHRAAARLWRIEGYGRAALELTIPESRRHPGMATTVHRSRQMALAGRTRRSGVPVTGLARTVLDLAAVESRTGLDRAVDAVLRSNRLRWHDLMGVLVRHSKRGRDGCGRLRDLLDDRYGEERPPGSAFNRMVADLFEDASLPEFQFEYELFDRDRFVARVDLAFPSARVAVELDSRAYHDNPISFVEDRRRANRIVNLGWRLLHFTWDDYRDSPWQMVSTVRAALGAAGAQAKFGT